MNPKHTFQDVPHSRIRAQVRTNSFNEENNTIEVVFATEHPVRRYDWARDRYYNEVLEVSPEAMDLSRLQNGAPVLDSHDNYSLDSIIGVVESVWLDGDRAMAKIRLSDEAPDATLVSKIKKGIIRNVSVGYAVNEYTIKEDTDEPFPEYRATRWTPSEISFVGVPADPDSGVRKNNNQKSTKARITNLRTMDTKETKKTTAPVVDPAKRSQPATAATATNQDEIRSAAIADERKRVERITTACQRAGIKDQKFIQNLIKTGVTINKARAQIIDEVAKRQNPAPTNAGRATLTGEDETRQTRNAIIDGFMERVKPGSVKDFGKKTKAREYRHMRLLDLARERLRASGERHTMLSDQEIVKRAWATTDYPLLLTETIDRTLRRDYASRIEPWQMIARRESANDFRVKTGIKIDGVSKFQEIPEGGEYKSTPIIQDEAATLQLKRFGQAHSITYEAIVNDDLGVFSRIPRIIGIDAQRFQSDTIWGLITSNAKAPDGENLFHNAKHGNNPTNGAAISVQSISAGRAALRRMKSPAGNPIGVAPRYLIVPPELETVAQQLVSSIYAGQVGDVNVFSDSLEVIVSNTLTDPKAWYLAADPNEITADGLVYSYLDGNEGVNIDSFVDPYSDALVIKAHMAFDAAVWGYQGWYKNSGA